MKLLHRGGLGLAIPILILLSSCGSTGNDGGGSGGSGGRWTGPGSNYADKLLSYVDYSLPSQPPYGTNWNKIQNGGCQRDSYVAAAIAEAWAANAHAWVGNTSQAAQDITAMCSNLKNADSLCSNAPVFGSGGSCITEQIYGCGANGSAGLASTQGCP